MKAVVEAVATVVAVVKRTVARVVSLVAPSGEAKKPTCSKVVCIKAAKKAQKGTKRARTPKKSKN